MKLAMKFIPYHQLAKTPNIVVDGEAQQGTLLTLSHWPKSGTPWPLRRRGFTTG